MFKKYIIIAFAILFQTAPVQAQHSLVLQKLKEWDDAAPVPRNDILKTEILRAAVKIYGPSDSCSKSSVAIDRVHPATAERFVFSAVLNHRMRNAWTVTARLPGCDNVPVRYMIMQNLDESLQVIRVNRGKSYAWDSLISDTLPLVRLAALASLKREGIDCGEVDGYKLGVTRIASEGDGLSDDLFGVRYNGVWGEIWPIEICDRIVEVAVNFTADGDGGAYSHMPGDKIAILPK